MEEAGGKNTKVCGGMMRLKLQLGERRMEVLAPGDEEAKERCMEAYREEKRAIRK